MTVAIQADIDMLINILGEPEPEDYRENDCFCVWWKDRKMVLRYAGTSINGNGTEYLEGEFLYPQSGVVDKFTLDCVALDWFKDKVEKAGFGIYSRDAKTYTVI